MAAGEYRRTERRNKTESDHPPAGSDSTALKYITAEQPNGEQASKVLQQIPHVQSCHSCGFVLPCLPIQEIQETSNAVVLGLVRQAIKQIVHSAAFLSVIYTFCSGIKVYVLCHTAVNLVCYT